MRLPFALLLAFIGVTALPLPATASDVSFQEAARQCGTSVEAHPFRVRLLIGQQATYVLVADTAFTRCLSKEADAKDDDGNERRYSLGANLDRAIRQCGERFGRPNSFIVDFKPEQGYLSARLEPGYSKSQACVAMIAGMLPGFGAKK